MFIRTAAAALTLVAGHAVAQQDAQNQQNTRHRQPAVQRPMQPGDTRAQPMHAGMELIPSEWVLGAKVIGSGGQDTIGKVKNLVISPGDGQIEYAVISHGGVLGVGGTLVAVPWDALQYQSKDRVLAIGMNEDQLKGAPEFKEEQWSMLGQPTWRQKTHEFFVGPGVGNADTKRDESWLANSSYQQLVRSGQKTTVQGVVKDIQNDEPGKDMADGCIVTIADANGTERIVHLGPSWFVKHQPLILKTGENVQVQGAAFTLDGRSVVAADTLSGPEGTFRFRDQQGVPLWDAAAQAGGASTAQGRPQNPGQNEAQQQAQAPDRAVQPVPSTGQHRILGTPEMNGRPYVKGSDLKGQDLKTAQGEDAGTVKDFVFDAHTGRMSFLVVSLGGFLGIGDKQLAVPWEAFTVNSDGKLMLSNMNKDQLKSAPEITRSDWSELSDPTFVNRVDQAFGITREEGGPGMQHHQMRQNDNNGGR